MTNQSITKVYFGIQTSTSLPKPLRIAPIPSIKKRACIWIMLAVAVRVHTTVIVRV